MSNQLRTTTDMETKALFQYSHQLKAKQIDFSECIHCNAKAIKLLRAASTCGSEPSWRSLSPPGGPHPASSSTNL